MHESPENAPNIIAVLSAFVRTHAVAPAEFPEDEPIEIPALPVDVSTAITTLLERPNPDAPGHQPDLRYTWFRDDQAYGRNSLRGATLNGMDLSGAVFGPLMDLSNTQFKHAHLAGTNLSEADLRNTRLDGADLRGAAGLHQEQLKGSKGDAETRLPYGLRVQGMPS